MKQSRWSCIAQHSVHLLVRAATTQRWRNMVFVVFVSDELDTSYLFSSSGTFCCISATKFAMPRLMMCEKLLKHVTCKHELKTAFLNNWFFPAWWNSIIHDGYEECFIGNFSENTLSDFQLWLGKANSNNFLEYSTAVIARIYLLMLTMDANMDEFRELSTP